MRLQAYRRHPLSPLPIPGKPPALQTQPKGLEDGCCEQAGRKHQQGGTETPTSSTASGEEDDGPHRIHTPVADGDRDCNGKVTLIQNATAMLSWDLPSTGSAPGAVPSWGTSSTLEALCCTLVPAPPQAFLAPLR